VGVIYKDVWFHSWIRLKFNLTESFESFIYDDKNGAGRTKVMLLRCLFVCCFIIIIIIIIINNWTSEDVRGSQCSSETGCHLFIVVVTECCIIFEPWLVVLSGFSHMHLFVISDQRILWSRAPFENPMVAKKFPEFHKSLCPSQDECTTHPLVLCL
jgi:hypothetical protein